MAEVFNWNMSAALHKDSVDIFRDAIVDSHSRQTDLPISHLLSFLPLSTTDDGPIGARGAFTWDEDTFVNQSEVELFATFQDQVLGDFSVTIPKNFGGSVRIVGTTLTIELDEPIEISIPKIASLGINRSIKQNYSKSVLNPEVSKSEFLDAVDQNKVTWILAELMASFSKSDQSNLNHIDALPGETKDLGYFEVLSSGGEGCGGAPTNGGDGPKERTYYVYQKNWENRQCKVFVNRGKVYDPDTRSLPNYWILFGPDTLDKCKKFKDEYNSGC